MPLLALTAAMFVGVLLTRGTIAPSSRLTQGIRAQYVGGTLATRLFPFSYRRLVAAALPFVLSMFLIAWLPILGYDYPALGWAIVVLVVTAWLITAAAFIYPRPFLPRWIRDYDDGRSLGVDTKILERVERADRPLSPRAFALANSAAATLFVLGIALHAPGSVLFGICFGWSALWSGQHAR